MEVYSCVLDKDLNMYYANFTNDFNSSINIDNDIANLVDKCLDYDTYIDIEGNIVSINEGILYSNVVDADMYNLNIGRIQLELPY